MFFKKSTNAQTHYEPIESETLCIKAQSSEILQKFPHDSNVQSEQDIHIALEGMNSLKWQVNFYMS